MNLLFPNNKPHTVTGVDFGLEKDEVVITVLLLCDRCQGHSVITERNHYHSSDECDVNIARRIMNS